MNRLTGTGQLVCECGLHKTRCEFGHAHSWTLATVDHRTGKPLERPMLHCMRCDSYCPDY